MRDNVVATPRTRVIRRDDLMSGPVRAPFGREERFIFWCEDGLACISRGNRGPMRAELAAAHLFPARLEGIRQRLVAHIQLPSSLQSLRRGEFTGRHYFDY